MPDADVADDWWMYYEISGDGVGVHWPDVDEDISAQGMLTGIPARPPKQKV